MKNEWKKEKKSDNIKMLINKPIFLKIFLGL